MTFWNSEKLPVRTALGSKHQTGYNVNFSSLWSIYSLKSMTSDFSFSNKDKFFGMEGSIKVAASAQKTVKFDENLVKMLKTPWILKPLEKP